MKQRIITILSLLLVIAIAFGISSCWKTEESDLKSQNYNITYKMPEEYKLSTIYDETSNTGIFLLVDKDEKDFNNWFINILVEENIKKDEFNNIKEAYEKTAIETTKEGSVHIIKLNEDKSAGLYIAMRHFKSQKVCVTMLVKEDFSEETTIDFMKSLKLSKIKR